MHCINLRFSSVATRPFPSDLSSLQSKATGGRAPRTQTRLGSIGDALLCRDSVVLMRAWHYARCSIGSSKLDTALAAPSLGWRSLLRRRLTSSTSVATRQRLKASFNFGFPPSRLSHQKASFHGIRLGVGSSLRSLLRRLECVAGLRHAAVHGAAGGVHHPVLRCAPHLQ